MRGSLTVLALAATLPVGAQRIGTFDIARGGQLSIASAPQTSEMRSAILAAFPTASLATTSSVTSAFLGSVDLVIFSSATGGSSAIVPLTAAEQTALRNYVVGGGSVLVFSDNDSFAGGDSDPANESLLDAFGFDATGTAPGPQNVTAGGAGNPITGGPFGTVTSATYVWPGGFNALPPEAISVATVDSLNLSGAAYIPRGVLGASAGAVVAMSDSSILYNGFGSTGSTQMVLNSIQYAAVPEPGSLAALALGAAALLRRRRAHRD